MILVAISPRLHAIILLNGFSSNKPPEISAADVEKSLFTATGSADLNRSEPDGPERVGDRTEAEHVMVLRAARAAADRDARGRPERPVERRRARVAAGRIILS